jgi:hypothetical protein
MNKFILSFVLLLCIGYATDKQQSNKTKDIAKVELPKTGITTIANNVITITDELYTLQFKIEKTKNNKHNLVIAMELHKGSSFISPFEKTAFKGKFYTDLGSYDNLTFDGNIIETPRSAATFDHFANEPVIWVKVNTTYKQPLNILSEDNFEVFGRVMFTIEPRCTFEEIPFAISYKDGVVTFIDSKC